MTDSHNEEKNESSVISLSEASDKQPEAHSRAAEAAQTNSGKAEAAEPVRTEEKAEETAEPAAGEPARNADKGERNAQASPAEPVKDAGKAGAAGQKTKGAKKNGKKKKKNKEVKLNKAALITAIVSGLLLFFWMYVVIPVPDDSICPRLTVKIRRFLDPYTKYKERPNCIYNHQYDD